MAWPPRASPLPPPATSGSTGLSPHLPHHLGFRPGCSPQRGPPAPSRTVNTFSRKGDNAPASQGTHSQLERGCSRWSPETPRLPLVAAPILPGRSAPQLTDPSANAFSSWTTAEFLWLRQRGAAVHTVYSNTILAMFTMFFFFSPSLFPAGSATIRGAVGRARLHVAFQGGVFAARRNPVRSPLPLHRASPSPTAPTPANGPVSVNTEDETHVILNVSLSRSHVSFHCASGLSHASNSQGPSWAPPAEDFAVREPQVAGPWIA